MTVEFDRWGFLIEFDDCQTCGGETPLSVNTVGVDGVKCVLCRINEPQPPGSVRVPLVWTLEDLVGTIA